MFFGIDYFKISYTIFRNKYPSIVDQIRGIGKQNPDVKKYVLKTFSKTEWSLLSVEIKSRHSLVNCDGCLKKGIYKSVLAQFPIKKLCFGKKAEKAGLQKTENRAVMEENCGRKVSLNLLIISLSFTSILVRLVHCKSGTY